MNDRTRKRRKGSPRAESGGGHREERSRPASPFPERLMSERGPAGVSQKPGGAGRGRSIPTAVPKLEDPVPGQSDLGNDAIWKKTLSDFVIKAVLS